MKEVQHLSTNIQVIQQQMVVIYVTRILARRRVSRIGYVSDTDTCPIRVGYVSEEYPVFIIFAKFGYVG